MPIELPTLPYALDAFEPYISATTHHKAYVDETNALVAGWTLADRALEEIVVASEFANNSLVGAGFRQAAAQ